MIIDKMLHRNIRRNYMICLNNIESFGKPDLGFMRRMVFMNTTTDKPCKLTRLLNCCTENASHHTQLRKGSLSCRSMRVTSSRLRWKHVILKKPAFTTVQRPMPVFVTRFVDLDLGSLDPKNGFSGLVLEHFYVKCGDPGFIGI